MEAGKTPGSKPGRSRADTEEEAKSQRKERIIAELTFYPDERTFEGNLRALRSMLIYDKLPLALVVIRNGKAHSADAARVIRSGFGGKVGFGYTKGGMETRCLLEEINEVRAFLKHERGVP